MHLVAEGFHRALPWPFFCPISQAHHSNVYGWVIHITSPSGHIFFQTHFHFRCDRSRSETANTSSYSGHISLTQLKQLFSTAQSLSGKSFSIRKIYWENCIPLFRCWTLAHYCVIYSRRIKPLSTRIVQKLLYFYNIAKFWQLFSNTFVVQKGLTVNIFLWLK